MNAITPDSLLSTLRWRYAVKQFDPSRKIDPATWSALEESLVLSPSSFGLQPWKFIVVDNPAIREELAALSWGQRQVADASHLVVFTVRHPLTIDDVRRHILRTAEVRSVPAAQLASFEQIVSDFITNMPFGLELRSWSTRQVYIAMGNFMTAAALLGVDTCPMEGLDPAGYDRVLGLEGSGFFTVAACPAGYRSENDKYATLPKVRFPLDQVITHLS